MLPIDKIYIHFADHYHANRAKRNGAQNHEIYEVISFAYRLACVFAEEVVFPASSVFESPNCRKLIAELPIFRTSGIVRMMAGDPTLDEHLEGKILSYGSANTQDFLKSYRGRYNVGFPSYDAKEGSSTSSVASCWLEYCENTDFIRKISEKDDSISEGKIYDVLREVPDRLGKYAFVPINVCDVLSIDGLSRDKASEISLPIEWGYVSGYVAEINAKIIYDIPFLSWRNLEKNLEDSFGISYQVVFQDLNRLGIRKEIAEAAPENLMNFRLDPVWKILSNALVHGGAKVDLDQEISHLRGVLTRSSKSKITLFEFGAGNEEMVEYDYDTAIVTALSVEFAAVRLLLANEKRIKVKGDPGVYYQATAFVGTPNERVVLVGMLSRMGTNAAAAAGANLLRSFAKVENIIFCGIALGVPRQEDPDKHVRLGDIVISDRNGVIQTDFVAKKTGGEENRSQLPPPPATFMNALNLLEADRHLGDEAWLGLIKQASKRNVSFARPDASTDIIFDKNGERAMHPDQFGRVEGVPKVFRGIIGSSNALIKDANERDRLAKDHNLLAMEMEGAGILEGAWLFGKSAMIVRGVCDYGVPKSDRWHNYAALVAAAASLALLERLGA